MLISAINPGMFPRRIRTHFVAPVLLLACALLQPGCTHYDLADTDGRDYRVFEQGTLKHFHVAAVGVLGEILFIPGPAIMKIALVEKLPNDGEFFTLRKIANNTPPWRRLDGSAVVGLCESVHALAGGTAAEKVRWIIGNNPVIVGIGEDDVSDRWSSFPGGWFRERDGERGRVSLGAGQKLIGPDDLPRRVRSILVLENWPAYIGQGANISPSRSVDLPAPLTLEEVLARKPWIVSSVGDRRG
jgi:hypothetical protein